MDALAVCVRSNFAGTESVKMYSEVSSLSLSLSLFPLKDTFYFSVPLLMRLGNKTFVGTKKLVESHINEVTRCLDFIRTASDVSLEEKKAFFRAVNKNYGSSALCLSGGASFGYYQYVLFGSHDMFNLFVLPPSALSF